MDDNNKNSDTPVSELSEDKLENVPGGYLNYGGVPSCSFEQKENGPSGSCKNANTKDCTNWDCCCWGTGNCVQGTHAMDNSTDPPTVAHPYWHV